MEDGPKLLPQWLRASSTALHNRGDAADSVKRTKPTGADITASTRPPFQAPDPWLSRGPALNPASGLIPTAVGSTSSSSGGGGKASHEFGRAPDRGSQTERSWKSRGDVNGYGGPGPHRSSYVPASSSKLSQRDDRDGAGISLKPGGSAGYGPGRSYRPAESEGGILAQGGRLEWVQDGWGTSRATSAGGGGPGAGGGPPGRSSRGEDHGRSPARGGMANSAAASGEPSKASFDHDFPSMRPSPGSSGSPLAAPALSAASSAPLASASASSPLLDTASSGSSLLTTPYRQTFLSSRTSSNWTSKLAEAPAAPNPPPPQPTPSAAWGDDEPGTASAQPPHALTPSPSPSPPPMQPAVAPAAVAPAPVVPPRPAGVWGASTAAATVAAAPVVSDGVNGTGAAGSGGVSASSRARLEQLAVRQSKQLIPVINSGGSKSKGAHASGGAGAAGSRAGSGWFGVPKPSPTPAGMLKMSSVTSKGGDGGGGVPFGMLNNNNTVILCKKASQPLDRPLTLARTASASTPPATLATQTSVPPPASASAGNLAAFAYGDGGGGLGGTGAAGTLGGAAGLAPPVPVPAVNGWAEGGIGGPAVATVGAISPIRPACSLAPDAESTRTEPSLAAGGVAAAGHPVSPTSAHHHPALQVSQEEEAFLRSLGWTGFDEEDSEEGDTGLTEEEIAAFRAQQQRQQQQQQSQPTGAPLATPLAILGPVGSSVGLSVGGAKPIPVVVAAAAAAAAVAVASKPVPTAAAGRVGRCKPLIVAASYGSEQICSSTDSDSECE